MPMTREEAMKYEVGDDGEFLTTPEGDFILKSTTPEAPTAIPVPKDYGETEQAILTSDPTATIGGVDWATQVFPRSMKRQSMEIQGVEQPFLGDVGASVADVFSLPARAYGSLGGTPMAQYEQDNNTGWQNIYRDPTLAPSILTGGIGVGMAKTAMGKFGTGALASLATTFASDMSRRSGLEEGASMGEYGLSGLLGGGLAYGGSSLAKMLQARRLQARLPKGETIPTSVAGDESLYTMTEGGLNRQLESRQTKATSQIGKEAVDRETEKIVDITTDPYTGGVNTLDMYTLEGAQLDQVDDLSVALTRKIYDVVRTDSRLASESMSAIGELNKYVDDIKRVIQNSGHLRNQTTEEALVKELIKSKNPLLKEALASVYGKRADILKFSTLDTPMISKELPLTSNLATLGASVAKPIIANPKATTALSKLAPTIGSEATRYVPESETEKRWKDFATEAWNTSGQPMPDYYKVR